MKKSLKLTNRRQLLKGAVILCFVAIYQDLQSQSTTAGIGNTQGIPGFDFLGWDNTVNSNLVIRHNEPGQPIIFKIDDVELMRYTEDAPEISAVYLAWPYSPTFNGRTV